MKTFHHIWLVEVHFILYQRCSFAFWLEQVWLCVVSDRNTENDMEKRASPVIIQFNRNGKKRMMMALSLSFRCAASSQSGKQRHGQRCNELNWIANGEEQKQQTEQIIVDNQKCKRLQRQHRSRVQWNLAIEITNDINYTLIYEMINWRRGKKREEKPAKWGAEDRE